MGIAIQFADAGPAAVPPQAGGDGSGGWLAVLFRYVGHPIHAAVLPAKGVGSDPAGSGAAADSGGGVHDCCRPHQRAAVGQVRLAVPDRGRAGDVGQRVLCPCQQLGGTIAGYFDCGNADVPEHRIGVL